MARGAKPITRATVRRAVSRERARCYEIADRRSTYYGTLQTKSHGETLVNAWLSWLARQIAVDVKNGGAP